MAPANMFRLMLLGAAGLALAGCGGGGSGHSSPVVVKPTLEQMFGNQFAVDFAANANSTPVVPAAGDVIALSLTTQPIPLH